MPKSKESDAALPGFVEDAVQLIMNSDLVYARLNTSAAQYLMAEGNSVGLNHVDRATFMMRAAKNYTSDVMSATHRIIHWRSPELLERGYYPTAEDVLEVLYQVGRKVLSRVRAIEGGSQ